VTVRGRVQGVGFRAGAAGRARSLGLRGWVRNRADGSVEALLDGEEGAVETLVRWLGEGPRGARVDGLAVRRADGEAVGAGFEVR
jgi:acylphosphatase